MLRFRSVGRTVVGILIVITRRRWRKFLESVGDVVETRLDCVQKLVGKIGNGTSHVLDIRTHFANIGVECIKEVGEISKCRRSSGGCNRSSY